MKFTPFTVIGLIGVFAGVVVTFQPASDLAGLGGTLLCLLGIIAFVIDKVRSIEIRVRELEGDKQ